ncbi:MAG TPA: aldehyde dehydrogenase family protein [Vicinamibacterales bacterium]|jgi:aldehyde dehydrogenase (NAD+)|nr:aldehyde dehydrogenase family protein [Vicinamibacterales bacterium]
MIAFPNVIDGQTSDAGERVPNINPSNLHDVIGDFAVATPADVHAAVAAARRAFASWSQSSPQVRFDVLDRAGTEILARKDELGRMLARENGKPLMEGVGEAGRAGAIVKFFAGEALRNAGEKFDSTRPGVEVEITREPLGVVGLITPWNFPLAIPAWKIAPALAYGNTIVLKPSEIVPASPWLLVDIFQRAGLPAGVLNIVQGPGASVGAALASSPDIDAISFTGSQAVGRSIAAAAVNNGTRVQLEMGGKNPLIVLDDADLKVAVSCAINGAFFGTGQRCTASSRLIVAEGIHDRFLDAIVERMSTLVIDDALKPGTEIGPVVDQRQLDKNMKYLQIGRDEGARLVTGGERLARATDGFYMAPAIFAESTPAMRINQEEIFGPIAAVIRVKNYEEALAIANDTTFGLSAGICTTSLKAASHFKRHAQSGLVMVNLPTAGLDYHVPFGGRKKSSYGPREQGGYAKEFYTIVKTAYVAP